MTLVETTRWTHPEETGGKVFSLINIIIYAVIPCLSLFPSNMSPISSIVQVLFIIRRSARNRTFSFISSFA